MAELNIAEQDSKYTFIDWLNEIPEPQDRDCYSELDKINKAKRQTFDWALDLSLETYKKQFLNKISILQGKKRTDYLDAEINKFEKIIGSSEFEKQTLILKNRSDLCIQKINQCHYKWAKIAYRKTFKNKNKINLGITWNLNPYLKDCIAYEKLIFLSEFPENKIKQVQKKQDKPKINQRTDLKALFEEADQMNNWNNILKALEDNPYSRNYYTGTWFGSSQEIGALIRYIGQKYLGEILTPKEIVKMAKTNFNFPVGRSSVSLGIKNMTEYCFQLIFESDNQQDIKK